MEDAMIINKMALDRGFAHGSIFKTELIETKVYLYEKYRLFLLLHSKLNNLKFFLATYLFYARPIQRRSC